MGGITLCCRNFHIFTDDYFGLVRGWNFTPNNNMDDVFNMENESFMQETRLMTNDIYRKSRYQVLLREEVARRLDQRGEPLSLLQVFSAHLAQVSHSPW